ncbi:hypothetical protein JHW43_002511 [Diplocarpon mali]|nr:hypothetical protein JHW43_002511 [Diplocarpon mali]
MFGLRSPGVPPSKQAAARLRPHDVYDPPRLALKSPRDEQGMGISAPNPAGRPSTNPPRSPAATGRPTGASSRPNRRSRLLAVPNGERPQEQPPPLPPPTRRSRAGHNTRERRLLCAASDRAASVLLLPATRKSRGVSPAGPSNASARQCFAVRRCAAPRPWRGVSKCELTGQLLHLKRCLDIRNPSDSDSAMRRPPLGMAVLLTPAHTRRQSSQVEPKTSSQRSGELQVPSISGCESTAALNPLHVHDTSSYTSGAAAYVK